MKTTYHVCTSTFGWHEPHAVHCAHQHPRSAAHRSIRAALLADDEIQRGCKRYHGPKNWIDTKILASDDRGKIFRPLTTEEKDELTYQLDQIEREHER